MEQIKQKQQAQEPANPEKYQFPTEEVTLPSKGLLYPEGHPLRSGKVNMKYMTAKEEDILTNQNLIKNGTVIDKLLQSLVVDPINVEDLLIGDKNAILVAARILGYGQDYTFKYPNPSTGEDEEVTIDLTEANDKPFDESKMINGQNEFEFNLPLTKKLLTFKLLTQADDKKIEAELKGLKKINKKSDPQLTTRLKHILTSVDGNDDQAFVRKFVDNELLSRDSLALRNHIQSFTPDIEMDFIYTSVEGNEHDIAIPLTVEFFWPRSA